ncbi:MAG: FtsX-like permease family protein [Luteitalea sp.]|nr:FtsX-like permease family protein [Luteitalea sp.]
MTRFRGSVETISHDVRYAVRALGHTPAFTAAALVTLALGIGATAAIFSVVNAALLKPPPYPEPDRMLVLTSAGGGAQTGEVFHDVRERLRSFETIAAIGGGTGWNLVAGDRAEYVEGLPVSSGYFDVLGVRPIMGRGFTAAEDQPDGPHAVILSHSLWRRFFDGSSKAIGQQLLLGGIPHTVVGVTPPEFQSFPPADLWTPLQVSPQSNAWNFAVFGRLRPGMAPAQAASELDLRRLAMQEDLRSISEQRSRSIMWIPYQQWLGLANRDALLILLAAVGCLLLIACANVASLQLVRGIGRRREMATRAAVGAWSARLMQQVLTESILLGMAGAVLGLVVARWGVRSLLALLPEGWLIGPVDLDWRVLLVTLVLAVGAGILFGLVPAVGAARLDVRSVLGAGGRQTAGPRMMWLRRAFAVTEVALAVVLLVGAGLLIRTFVNLRSAELGFDPSNIVVGKMSLQGSTAQSREQPAVFFERTLARLREVPGVLSAAVASNVPVEQGLNLPLEPPPDALIRDGRAVDWRYVTSEYLELFQIPIRAGRGFDARDRADGVPVALVNEAFASTYFGGAAVGRSLQLERNLGDPPREIVGIVRDVKSRSHSGWTSSRSALGTAAAPTIYVPATQVPDTVFETVHHFLPVSWVVRTNGPSGAVAPAIQQVVGTIEPTLPFIQFQSMEEVIAKDVDEQRFLMVLLAVFAGVALTLALIGIYGLVAHSASQRTQEMGLRMALGAGPLRVLGQFLREGFKLAIIGVAIGLIAAAGLSQVLTYFVFGVTPLDPVTFVAVGAVSMLAALLATLVPAVRAANIDPSVALRWE